MNRSPVHERSVPVIWILLCCLGILLPLQATLVTLTPTVSDSYIRNGIPDNAFDTAELLVGRVTAADHIRSLLGFDLSTIPDGATINAVTLSLSIGALDPSSLGAGTGIGVDGIRVYEVTQDATEAATWNTYDGANAWATAGGDFSSTPLAIIDLPTGPDAVTLGETFNFLGGSAFQSTVSSNLADDFIQIMVRTPGIETPFNIRKLYRFASGEAATEAYRPMLTIDYSAIPEPSTIGILGLGVGIVLLLRRKKIA